MDHQFAFVVLHYGCYETTKSTLDKLLKVRRGGNTDFNIIVVDNGSHDHAGEQYKAEYSNEDRLFIIINETNEGFSKGMNAGFMYAKNELGCDFIVLMNNDIEILTESICDLCINDYNEYDYAVLGPQIHNADSSNLNKNPHYTSVMSLEQKLKAIKREFFKINYRSFFAHIGLLHQSEVLLKLLMKGYWSVSKTQGKQVKKSRENTDKIVFDTGLHGCFWVFSPKYVSEFDGLEEVTFAYGEEWLLYYRCNCNNMIMMYEPNLEVFHSEHMVMKSISTNPNKQYLYRAKMQRDSLKLQKKYVLTHLANPN